MPSHLYKSYFRNSFRECHAILKDFEEKALLDCNLNLGPV